MRKMLCCVALAAIVTAAAGQAALAAEMKLPPAPTACQAKANPMKIRGDAVKLNPQPEPPGVNARTRSRMKPGDAVKLNPQPEPPGVQDRAMAKAGVAKPGDTVMFNPQPDPPGSPVACKALTRRG